MNKHAINLTNIHRQLDSLQKWLSANGAEVLTPTNEYEVLRFKAGGITSIVYRKGTGGITLTGQSLEAITAFFTAKSWRAAEPTKRRNVSPHINTVIKRDGDLCFACGWPVSDGDASIDHLVPITHQGPNHISNFVLMHVSCNQHCGHMSAAEKIKMHVEWQIASAGLRRAA